MENKILCRLVKDKQEINEIKIRKSGFFTIINQKLFFSENLLDLPLTSTIYEIFISKNSIYLSLRNYYNEIQNKKIYEEKLYKNLPSFFIKENPINLNISDIIKIKNSFFLVGIIHYKNKTEILRHSEIENSSQITILHHRSFFKNWEQPKKICYLCKKNEGNLFLVCECKRVHIFCFKNFFENKKIIKVYNSICKISIKDYFCDNCDKFFFCKLIREF